MTRSIILSSSKRKISPLQLVISNGMRSFSLQHEFVHLAVHVKVGNRLERRTPLIPVYLFLSSLEPSMSSIVFLTPLVNLMMLVATAAATLFALLQYRDVKSSPGAAPGRTSGLRTCSSTPSCLVFWGSWFIGLLSARISIPTHSGSSPLISVSLSFGELAVTSLWRP